MPHEIAYTVDGEAMMMFVGDEPWHGLGTRMDDLVDPMTAVQVARCDYTVEAQPMYRNDGSTFIEYPNRYAIVRTDTGQEFDIVSNIYEIHQNMDTARFVNEVFAQGEAVIETCGALKGGRQFWMMARLPEVFEPVPNDPIGHYLLFSSSHDRTQQLEAAITDVRTVCSNTLRFALRQAQYRIQIRHTASIHDRAVEVRESLHLDSQYHQLLMDGIGRLVATPMRGSEMNQYAESFLNLDPKVANTDRHVYSREAVDTLCELFEAGRGQDIPGVRGTAYAALNATTEFLDYHKRVQVPNLGSESDVQHTLAAQDSRLHRSWFGRGQNERNHGWDLLQKFSDVGISAFQGTYTPRVRNTARADGQLSSVFPWGKNHWLENLPTANR